MKLDLALEHVFQIVWNLEQHIHYTTQEGETVEMVDRDEEAYVLSDVLGNDILLPNIEQL